jgi:hypothetical protein
MEYQHLGQNDVSRVDLKHTCWTSRIVVRSQVTLKSFRLTPSSLMSPLTGLYHLSKRPIIVLFPEPLAPYWCVSSPSHNLFYNGLAERIGHTTKAVTFPAGIVREMSSSTLVSGRVG